MLLRRPELSELHQHLDEQMYLHTDADGNPMWDCDHTLKHTHAWLKSYNKALRDNVRAISVGACPRSPSDDTPDVPSPSCPCLPDGSSFSYRT